MTPELWTRCLDCGGYDIARPKPNCACVALRVRPARVPFDEAALMRRFVEVLGPWVRQGMADTADCAAGAVMVELRAALGEDR